MRQDLQKFVATFRELERRNFSLTREEEQSWERLKHRLAVSAAEQPSPQSQKTHARVVAVASLYSQAGASFIASNFAYLQSNQKIPTTLCEFPYGYSYFYFSLDCERRAGMPEGMEKNGQRSHLIRLQQGMLRVKVEHPGEEKEPLSQIDAAHWFLSISKSAPLVVVDLSSRWQSEYVDWMMEWVDEMWMVIDSDLPRLTRTFALKKAPKFWNEYRHKIRIIANKWSKTLKRAAVRKRVEGVLSLWDQPSGKNRIDLMLPWFDHDRVGQAQLQGKLFLEAFPDESECFQALCRWL